MPDTDQLAARLRRIPATDDVRAAAWDAFHEASNQDDLTERLRGLSIPDDAKADLWDMKSGRTIAPPSRGVSAPGDTFADKLASAASALGHGALGFAKGAARSALNIADTGMNAGVIPGGVPGMAHPAVDFLREADAPQGTAEKVGGWAETGAELAAPAMETGKLALMGGRAMATKAAPMARAAATALDSVHPAVLDLAAETIGHGLGAQLGVPTLARHILSYALKSARKAAPEVAEAVNAGGRVVPPQTPKLAEVLTDALEATRAEPSPRVTLPPSPELPAGYTPRTTVPKPRAVKMAGPTAPAAEPPAPPKRAYFLKSEADLAPVASPAPTGAIDPTALPASWQQHIGQDLFPLTGKESEEVAAALADELRSSGQSVGQAMMAVSKNPDIPVQFRQQLLKSLSRVNMKGGS